MRPVKLGVRLRCFIPAAILGLAVTAMSAYAQTVLGTPEQTNDRIKALSSRAHTTPHDYIIGSGDTLSIEVFDVKELSRDVRVSQTGTIGLPLVPVRLMVKGLTETQAEHKIAEVLQANGLVTHPEVTVSVKDRKSKPITVVGAVGHPMVYQADHPVTLLEVLAEAGGVANDAGDSVMVTRGNSDYLDTPADGPPISQEDVIPANGQNDAPRPGESSVTPAQPVSPATKDIPGDVAGNQPGVQSKGTVAPAQPPTLSNTITVNLNALMESGDATNNIFLQAGDIVTVPHAGIVYVLGAVGRPGGFVLANDRSQMTTLKMLALAGGLNRTAKSDQAVIIRKDNQGQQHEQVVDLKKVVRREAEDVRLEASDILYVPDSNVKRALARAGEIAISVGTGVALYRIAY